METAILRLKKKFTLCKLSQESQDPEKNKPLRDNRLQKKKQHVEIEQPTFHLFLQLPAELQLLIWSFAATPRLLWLEVDLLEEAMYYRRRSTLNYLYSRLSHTPLLHACAASRSVAKNAEGKSKLAVTSYYDYDNLEQLTRTRGHFLMKPAEPRAMEEYNLDADRDFLFVSHMEELVALTRLFDVGVVPKKSGDRAFYIPNTLPSAVKYVPKTPFAGIKRLVIGPCTSSASLVSGWLTEAYRNAYRWSNWDDNDVQIEILFFRAVTQFGDLEELLWVVKDKTEWKRSEGMKEGWEDALRVFRLKVCEKMLPKVRRESVAAWARMSAFWINPKITFITEEEFVDKFPQARTLNYPVDAKQCSKRMSQDPLVKKARLRGLQHTCEKSRFPMPRPKRVHRSTMHYQGYQGRPWYDAIYTREFRKKKYLSPIKTSRARMLHDERRS